jgi:hypothetical protein
MSPDVSYTLTSLSELFGVGSDVAWSRIFGENFILGYSQGLKLYQLLDLDATGEEADGEEESSMFPWMRKTRKFYLIFLKCYNRKMSNNEDVTRCTQRPANAPF